MVMWRPRTVLVVCGAAAALGCRSPKPTYEYEPAVTYTSTGSAPLRRQEDAPPVPAPAAMQAPPAAAAAPAAAAPGGATGELGDQIPEQMPAAAPRPQPSWGAPATASAPAAPADDVRVGAPPEPSAAPQGGLAPATANAPAIPSGQRMIVTPDGALMSSDGKVLAPPGSVTPVQGIPAATAPPPKRRATGWVHAND
jgi:hypothetical protein